MVSYNKVNGDYAAASKFLLTEVLRKKWGFKGIVISDWGACIGAPNCLKAGMSLAMPDSNGYFSHQLEKVYKDDAEVRAKLDEANALVIEAANKWTGGHQQKADNSKIDFNCDMEGQDGDIMRKTLPFAIFWILMNGLMVFLGLHVI